MPHLKASENRWSSLAGLPLWVPFPSQRGAILSIPTAYTYFLPRAVFAVLVIWCGALAGRIGMIRGLPVRSRQALAAHISASRQNVLATVGVTAAISVTVALLGPAAWYLTFHRNALFVTREGSRQVYLSFVPATFVELITVAFAAGAAFLLHRIVTRIQLAGRFCGQCGYDLAGLGGGRCPECGDDPSIWQPEGRRRIRAGTLCVAMRLLALLAAWAALLILFSQSARGYGLSDILTWIMLQPNV